MSPKEVTQLLAFLRGGYPNFEVKESTVAAWSLVLVDADAADIKAAALRYMREPHEWPPNPGILRSMAAPPDEEPLAEEAWEEVRANISAHEVRWSHPRIERAARMAFGDFRAWASNVLTESIHFDRARFVDTYQSIQGRNRQIDEYESACAILESETPRGIPGLRGIGALAGAAPGRDEQDAACGSRSLAESKDGRSARLRREAAQGDPDIAAHSVDARRGVRRDER